ncbi:hypothetical protein Hanom_Chr14g01274181 [Helianthus anomalus]
MCVCCGLREETTHHILWDCLVAKLVWWSVLVWLKLPFPSFDPSLEQLLGLVANNNGSTDWKKAVGAVIMVIFWEIWKARNDKHFNNHNVHYNRTADIIRENSFFWITSR